MLQRSTSCRQSRLKASATRPRSKHSWMRRPCHPENACLDLSTPNRRELLRRCRGCLRRLPLLALPGALRPAVPDRQGEHDRPRGHRHRGDGRPAPLGHRHDGDQRDRLDPGRAARDRADQCAGGMLGRKIKIIQEDGASDWPTFAEKAKKLLVNDKVAAVFGCWTSASRKAVLPVFEKENGMLYYPTFYEGLEQSKNVIYTGQEATQQIIWGLDWVHEGEKRQDLLPDRLGLHLAAHDQQDRPQAHRERAQGCKVVGEEYYPLGHTKFASLINKIKLKKPDCIYAIVVGGSQRRLLQAAQGRRHHRRQADPADDLGHRGRDPRHRRREHRRLLRLHEVLPERWTTRTTRSSSKAFKAKYGDKIGHRRRDAGRLPRALAVEADGREGRQLRRRQGRGRLARTSSSRGAGRLREDPREPPPVEQARIGHGAGRRPVQRDLRDRPT